MPPSWKLIIVIAAIIVVASGALVVYGLHLLARAIRKGRREEVAYDDEMADYVADQQTAVGRVAVPQPRWHVWDDEAEAGMTERQVQMLREGYVLLPEDLRGELMCPMLLPVDGCNCGPCIAARIEQARQESPSAEVYELTEREWADYVADQQTAVGRVAVPQPTWTRQATPGPFDAHMAAEWSRLAQVQVDPGVCAVMSGEPTSCRLCLPHRCEYSPAERPLTPANLDDTAGGGR